MALTRTQRRKAFRGAQYAILLAGVAALAIFVDWSNFGKAFFDPEVAVQLFPDILTIGLKNTLWYTVLGLAFGFPLALVLALMKLSSVAPYRWIATVYIEVFRGLPALLIVFVIGYGIPLALQVSMNRNVQIMIALGMVTAAFMAETLRAGIQAVPRGQVEAARSLGMSPGRTMVTVVMPQGFRIILPPLTNELIMLVKDTSLVFFLGASIDQQELTGYGRQMLNQFKSLTPFVVAGLCYLIITIPLSYLVRRLEAKYAKGR